MGEITLQASKKASSRVCQLVKRDSKQIVVLLTLFRIHPSAMEVANSQMVSTKLDLVTISVLMDMKNITSSSMSTARKKTPVVAESVQSKEKVI